MNKLHAFFFLILNIWVVTSAVSMSESDEKNTQELHQYDQTMDLQARLGRLRLIALEERNELLIQLQEQLSTTNLEIKLRNGELERVSRKKKELSKQLKLNEKLKDTSNFLVLQEQTFNKEIAEYTDEKEKLMLKIKALEENNENIAA